MDIQKYMIIENANNSQYEETFSKGAFDLFFQVLIVIIIAFIILDLVLGLKNVRAKNKVSVTSWILSAFIKQKKKQ